MERAPDKVKRHEEESARQDMTDERAILSELPCLAANAHGQLDGQQTKQGREFDDWIHRH